jgi:phosphoribosylformylglycinamidine synthase
MAIVPDVNRTATSDFKGTDNYIIIVGETRREVGGSVAARHLNIGGGVAPTRIADGPANARTVYGLIRDGLVKTCHDCSEGGLAVALSEMSIGGRIGCTVNLASVPSVEGISDAELAFSETNSRYVLEVEPGHLDAVISGLSGRNYAEIGRTGGQSVSLHGCSGEGFASVEVSALVESHQTPVL